MKHLPTGSWWNPSLARGILTLVTESLQFWLLCNQLVKAGNWKFHPAEGVLNVCCLFSFNYVNGDTSVAVKSTGQVMPLLGKPLLFLLQRNPLFFHKLMCIFRCCGQASHIQATQWANKRTGWAKWNSAADSRHSGSKTARVNKESKAGFRSQHNNF